MSDCEIYSFTSSRAQPKFDAEAIPGATLEDLIEPVFASPPEGKTAGHARV